MPPLAMAVLAVVLAYLIGAIPFGIVICRPLGVDPRTVGSGRTGGTNVYRAAGAWAGILTVLGDVLKGTVAVLLAERLVASEWQGLAVALAALAAILGHNYSIYIGFGGGAGATPNIGAFLALAPNPLAFVIAALISGAVWYGARIAAVASLTLSTCILASTVWFVVTGASPPTLLIYGAGQLALVTWALRPNIARLRAGTERRVDQLDTSTEPAPDPDSGSPGSTASPSSGSGS